MTFDKHTWAGLLNIALPLLNSQYAPYYQGAILPYFIAILQKPSSPKWVRVCVAILMCFGAALASFLLKSQVTLATLLPDAIITLITAVALYSHVYKHLGIGNWEAVTSNLIPTATASIGNVTKAVQGFTTLRDAVLAAKNAAPAPGPAASAASVAPEQPVEGGLP